MKTIIRINTDSWDAIFHRRQQAASATSWAVRDLSEVYFSGDLSDLLQEDRLKVLIVGSRDMHSETGAVVSQIITDLARQPYNENMHTPKPVIISGLAFGVDTCAHKAALHVGLPTVAVMATGLDTIYPYNNRELAEQICSTPGCGLLTQYPERTAPMAINFLDRTKTMVLMSDVVVVASCKSKGAGIVAARYANNFGIPVLAVPGRPSDRWSEGCNELIKSGMAGVITSAMDIYNVY